MCGLYESVESWKVKRDEDEEMKAYERCGLWSSGFWTLAHLCSLILTFVDQLSCEHVHLHSPQSTSHWALWENMEIRSRGSRIYAELRFCLSVY